jgi:hypothetical protein
MRQFQIKLGSSGQVVFVASVNDKKTRYVAEPCRLSH